MSDHPSTFGGSTAPSGEKAWEDRASLLRAAQDTLLPGSETPLLCGPFAEMIRHLVQLPEEERQAYVIAKAGDRTYGAEEAIALASEPGFPAEDPG
ncbi:MAG: hypothetical protein ACKO01_02205 [Erythrobacter sp.]